MSLKWDCHALKGKTQASVFTAHAHGISINAIVTQFFFIEFDFIESDLLQAVVPTLCVTQWTCAV